MTASPKGDAIVMLSPTRHLHFKPDTPAQIFQT